MTMKKIYVCFMNENSFYPKLNKIAFIHKPYAEEWVRQQNANIAALKHEFKQRYGLLEKDEARVKAYGEAHRDMLLLSDIEGPSEVRLKAREELHTLNSLPLAGYEEIELNTDEETSLV